MNENSALIFPPPQAEEESSEFFCNPPNISGASHQNSYAAFSSKVGTSFKTNIRSIKLLYTGIWLKPSLPKPGDPTLI